MYDKKIMDEAIALSRTCLATGKGGPFGAIVVKDGQIIGKGGNRVSLDQDPTAHAEIVAIREACRTLASFSLEGCEVYCSCEPCPMCLGALYWARPAKIYYAATKTDASAAGFDDSFIYEEIELDPAKRHIPTEQHEQQEAAEVLTAWSSLESKIEY
ncbi:MAG: nucleoside deaminase [Bacteroidales bacterium]|jgi:tRNA(Arg) A34 adenosine deaminase TadA|nr:nucleoside deaminase [Bacteroidales bacterium]